MADIFSVGINSAAPASRPQPKALGDESVSAAEILKQQNETRTADEQKTSDLSKDTGLDHVVAVSEDGDTLQVSDEGQEEVTAAAMDSAAVSGALAGDDSAAKTSAEGGSVAKTSTGDRSAASVSKAVDTSNGDRSAAAAADASVSAPDTRTSDGSVSPLRDETRDDTATGAVRSSKEENFNTETADSSTQADRMTAISEEQTAAMEESSAKREAFIREAAEDARKRADFLKEAAEDTADKEKIHREQREESEAEDAAATETAKQELTSYAGYSDEELHQMYLDGTISRYDYESEINSRKETREDLSMKALENSREVLGETQAYRRISRMGKAIETAYSDEANDTVSADHRMEALENLELANDPQQNLQKAQQMTTDEAALTVAL